MNYVPYGIVLGRFQPFHIGHLEYVKAAKRTCEHLVIGITNPDITVLRHHDSDPNRSKVDSNPFSYFVRHQTIRCALLGEGWSAADFSIVPTDLENPEKLGVFLPERDRSRVFVTIYDAWSEEKLRRISTQGYDVEVLWRRKMTDRATSGSEIRAKMRDGTPWRHLVPAGAAEYLNGRI